jgi:galactokinase
MTYLTKVTKSKRQLTEVLRPAEPGQKESGPMRHRKEGPAAEVLSPGRLCLFGEHSDWASEYALHPGYCIVVGTDQSIRATAEPSDVFCVETVVPDEAGRPSGRTRRMSCPWEIEALKAAAQDQGEFFRYCAGVAYEMLRRGYGTAGLDLRIVEMELPLKKGVSSSAAVCILVAKAFNECYGLHLLPHELMDISYHGERITGSQCGRMDQACIYGSVPVLLAFEPGGHVRIEPIFARDTLHLFYVDLAGKKDTVVILKSLHSQYRRDQALQQALGSLNEAIVRRAFSAVQNGRPADVGGLMTEAQEVFDRCVSIHCPEHLTAPLLHKVLALPEIQPHVYGGKGVGSQGDGTAQFVARSESDRDLAMQKIVQAFPQMRCFPLTIRGQRA